MVIAVHELDDASWKRWDAYVEACPEATFFHKAGWKRVIEDSFGQRGHFLFAERDGAIVGVLLTQDHLAGREGGLGCRWPA